MHEKKSEKFINIFEISKANMVLISQEHRIVKLNKIVIGGSKNKFSSLEATTLKIKVLLRCLY